MLHSAMSITVKESWSINSGHWRLKTISPGLDPREIYYGRVLTQERFTTAENGEHYFQGHPDILDVIKLLSPAAAAVAATAQLSVNNN